MNKRSIFWLFVAIATAAIYIPFAVDFGNDRKGQGGLFISDVVIESNVFPFIFFIILLCVLESFYFEDVIFGCASLALLLSFYRLNTGTEHFVFVIAAFALILASYNFPFSYLILLPAIVVGIGLFVMVFDLHGVKNRDVLILLEYTFVVSVFVTRFQYLNTVYVIH